MLGTPVLAPGSLFEGCGLSSPRQKTDSNEDLVALLQCDNHFDTVSDQASALDQYQLNYEAQVAGYSNFLRGR